MHIVPEISLLLIHIKDLGFCWPSTNLERKGGGGGGGGTALTPPKSTPAVP